MIVLHDPRCAEYEVEGHPESPARVLRSAAHLKLVRPRDAWKIPSLAPEDSLLLAHKPSHLERLREPHGFDADTPWYPEIDVHACRSAGAALDAATFALGGEMVFSLMRPPGHHACRNRVMGFCYLSSVAISALAALRAGADRVAVWDFDVHHGNGTEEIVRGQARIHFASIHQHPAYPGSGLESSGNIHNYPMAPSTPAAHHMEVLESSFESILKFKPSLLLVSAGFDAYARDPLAQMRLESEHFKKLGRWLRDSGLPTAAVLEGGYSEALPQLLEAFLAGWEEPQRGTKSR